MTFSKLPFFSSFLSLSHKQKTKLGRWKIDHRYSVINHKIDQANSDHSVSFTESYNQHKKHNNEEFLIPYCM